MDYQRTLNALKRWASSVTEGERFDWLNGRTGVAVNTATRLACPMGAVYLADFGASPAGRTTCRAWVTADGPPATKTEVYSVQHAVNLAAGGTREAEAGAARVTVKVLAGDPHGKTLRAAVEADWRPTRHPYAVATHTGQFVRWGSEWDGHDAVPAELLGLAREFLAGGTPAQVLLDWAAEHARDYGKDEARWQAAADAAGRPVPAWVAVTRRIWPEVRHGREVDVAGPVERNGATLARGDRYPRVEVRLPRGLDNASDPLTVITESVEAALALADGLPPPPPDAMYLEELGDWRAVGRSYKVGVKTARDREWVCNGLRFPTRAAAREYGADLCGRWTMVDKWTVLVSDDEPTAAAPASAAA